MRENMIAFAQDFYSFPLQVRDVFTVADLHELCVDYRGSQSRCRSLELFFSNAV